MGKKIARPGRLPFEGAAELCAIDRDDDQIFLTGEMFGSRFAELGGGREMNEAIVSIILQPVENAFGFGRAPNCCRTDFINC